MADRKTPHISIVIPNWNGKHFLKVCFDSIATQSYKGWVETVVVDNNSKDGSVEYIKKEYPWVRLVELRENQGFAGGVNRGIEAAEGELIFLLNNDTELDKHCLEAIAEAAKKHPEIGFFATKMLDFKDRTILDSCGDTLLRSGSAIKNGMGQKDGPEFSQEKVIFGAGGGAGVFRREFFAQVGLFDEDFFAYLEDVDLSFRAQLQGITCRFIPEAKVFHIGSATSGVSSPFVHRMVIKNHFWMLYKNMPTTYFFRNIFHILNEEIRLIIAAMRHGYFKEYRQALAEVWKLRGKMKRKRKEIQKKRTVDSEYLDTVMPKGSQYEPMLKKLVGRR